MPLGLKRALGGFSKYTGGIISSKNQVKAKRSHLVMDLFEKQTELTPNADKLPLAKLIDDADLGIYNTPDLNKDFPHDVQLIWSLASILYQVDKTNQKVLLNDWLRTLVEPGLEHQLERQDKIFNDDPFATAFVYLTFGQCQKASDIAKTHGDLHLSLFLDSEELQAKATARETLKSLQASGKWKEMSTFHRKCWYVISGCLGYIEEEGFTITEGVYWQCVLGMYIWYGSSLVAYNKAIKSSTEHMRAKSNIAGPDDECLWYQLLQWWLGDTSVANFDKWPLELPWLLSIYKNSNDIDEIYVDKFIDDLDTNDLAEWAIYASLFLKNSEKKVFRILRQCEWENEEKLLNDYHIPKKQIQLAKALNAHDSWDYDLEYEHLLEGELFYEAKLSLLYFLLPKQFRDNTTGIAKSIELLDKNLNKQDDDELLVLRNAYQYLSNEDEGTLEHELIQGLSRLEDKYHTRNSEILFNSLIDLVLAKSNPII